MTDKDEIRSLNTRINSLKFQIKQMNDFKDENISIKHGLEKIREDITKIENEKRKIQNEISPVFNVFKKLIAVNHTKYSNISASYNNDLLARMEKDNKYFADKIYQMEKKSDELINKLFEKVNRYLATNQQGENNLFDINTIKFNLFNILKEFDAIFEEIKIILDLSSQSIADEEEETLRNIQMIEIIVQEVDRIMEFVPLNQAIRNNILAQLGINALNYPLNTPTLKIILTSMQEIKRKRQTQLKNILDQIKNKSSKILEKQAKIKQEILSAINIIKNGGQNNKSETPVVSLEDLFTTAKENGQNNIKEFEKDVCGSLQKEINDFKQKLEEDRKKSEDLLSKAKLEFINQWAQAKSRCCEDILAHAKNSVNYFFVPRIDNYQKNEEITSFLKEKIYSPECNIINFGLINCTDSIKKIKEDVVPTKCIISIGRQNEYNDSLDELLVNTKYLYYKGEKELSQIYYDLGNNIIKITSIQNLDIIFPVLVVHYNDYSEFEKENYNLEKFIINCLKIKVGFLFFFGKIDSKEIKPTNKKIKEWINQSKSIKEVLEETKYELSSELCYNLDMLKDGVELEMEKLTNFKKDKKNKINKQSKQDLKTEYFNKMWDVYNTHSIVTDMESIQNAKDEETSRNRLVGSIMDYSILCLNLDKKPKDKQLKDKEQNAIFQGIRDIIDEVFQNELSKDIETFMTNLKDKKIFELFLVRERIMGEIDLKYNTALLNEEPDSDKIQKTIGEEISILVEKNAKNEILKLVGRLVWSRVFERYCPKFYILMENGFNIPENFEEYLIESLNPK